MKLDQLYFLKEAIKYGSISIAAEKNYITQPAFSSAIAKLEKELNTTLLQRTRKGVKPTKTCLAIMEKITIIFEAIDDIQLIASSQKHFGTVNISTLSCMCDKILSTVARKISEKNLPFTLSIECTDHEQILKNVSSGNSSFGFLFYTPKLAMPEIKYTDLFEDEFVAYVGSQSPFWNHTSISLKALLSQPYIAYKDEFLTEDPFSVILGGKPQVALRLNDVRFIKK